MIGLMKKLHLVKFVSILFIILLSACNMHLNDKFHRAGKEFYLNSPPLYKLNSLPNITFPKENDDYKIPPVPLKGDVGKDLDIRPPHHSSR
ncbi:putative lipoprotein [secondary endosymbiont of Heteropsylla cubana]|uniref:Putative lipoprotein n=1 Tax=secondary endosymbiont of Heteropsylla cubana TaxID=134287 RepID=J3YTQ8_9ENTR|nr:outer membrane protein assembly factor BamC [secondary endosymbiont of Heteropsylla cubana]AFP85853.1 putative lipoprotein [secondary endosymbiont of Heteropsylla cubana]